MFRKTRISEKRHIFDKFFEGIGSRRLNGRDLTTGLKLPGMG
ncbi:hypothetical protein KP77_07270 [Jeotgalibacillus alimentarius]|uniref:Uncharacterized protein n=1 Tax=Jeotgalibacillus alimentarius TaxID=135826 RepID=A0A0C2RLS5_9BACL|nr:hypothetical protein KP77_07270 [Jeotgalibacillus alimentarius]